MAELVEVPYTVPRVVTIISSLLQTVSEHNDIVAACSEPKKTEIASSFQSSLKPSISIKDYLERIFRYVNCSSSCYVVAYVYLDRFLHRNPSAAIDSFSVHRFIITSVLVAVKFMDDVHCNNAYFAKVGGINLVEMNYLEVDFLFGIGFELNITPIVFTSYCAILQSQMFVLERPPAPQRSACSLPDGESSSCHQIQVSQVSGT